MLDKFRNPKEEYWHRRNTFLMIHSGIESGLPIANALESHMPLYEPLSTELEIIHNGILAGRTLAEIAEVDFKKSPPPRWLTYLIKYEKKGQVSKGFLRLSRFEDKSFHKKIFWNLLFSSSNPPSICTWIIPLFLISICLPVLPWKIKENRIIILGLFKGNATNIYSMGFESLADFDRPDSDYHARKGDYLYDLSALTQEGVFDFPENFPKKKVFINEGMLLGFKENDLECMWAREFHRQALVGDHKIATILGQSSASPVPIVWLGRGLISSILAQLGQIDYNEKAMIEEPCKNSKLSNIFDLRSSSSIQGSKN